MAAGGGALHRPGLGGGLLSYLLVMLRLGTDPGAAMDPIAAFARDFLGNGPAHAVDYFAAVNLEGRRSPAVIGAGVYLLVVRTLLIRQGRYVDPIPPWLDLERGLYRLTLRVLAQAAIVLATLADRLAPRLLFHGLPRLFQRLRLWWAGTRDRLLLSLTGEVYSPRPTVEQAADDFHFARYEDEPRLAGGLYPLPGLRPAAHRAGPGLRPAVHSAALSAALTAPSGSGAARFFSRRETCA